MNWDDPEARFRLIERVGVDEYNRQLEEHHRQSIVTTVNGHAIRPVHSQRFGRIYMVGDTNKGHATLEGAILIAKENS